MEIRNDVFRRKDGSVTIRHFLTAKRKPRRKRRDNHRMRKALIRRRKG